MYMQFKKSPRNFFVCSITIFLTIFMACPSFTTVFPVSSDPEYTYYGVVPSKIYSYNLTDSNNMTSGWRFDPGSVGNASLVVTIAQEDDTHVTVNDLTHDEIADQFSLDSMRKHYTLLANGTMFKVVSDKQVEVMLLNYHSIPNATALEFTLPYGFYTSTDGLYVGKEFVILGSGNGIYADYKILALEKASVTVTKDDGTQFSLSVEANSYKDVTLQPFRVYRIQSTGCIMIHTGGIQGKGGDTVACFSVPAAQGGFVGTYFLTRSLKSQELGWDQTRDYGFRVTAEEDTHVKVYDLETMQVLGELTLPAGSGGRFQPESEAIAVQSDKPVTLSFIHNGTLLQMQRTGTAKYASYGHGVIFICIQPNEDTMVHFPTEAHIEAYFFAITATTITIDGDTFTANANSPLSYITPGTHTVRSDQNVVLQMNFWPLDPDFQGLEYEGTIIPCIETVNDNPDVTLVPIGEGFPMMYVVAGIGVAAVGAVVGILAMRKRSKSS